MHTLTHTKTIIIMYILICIFLNAKTKDSELNDSGYSLNVICT
jgi:hypothetical protein